jgi:sigma-E factor negative regulatory protein RseA
MKMSKETREHLSSLVDGEISLETSRFLVRRLGADDELHATWTRYHLIRDCLRHQDGAIAGEDLCVRVGRALEDEQAIKPSRALPRAWFKPVAGLAIAASVALMAIVTVGPGIPGTQQTDGELAVEEQAQSFISPQSYNPAPQSTQVNYTGSTNSKMNPYLLRHYQATGKTGGNGFVTFVPIVIRGSRVDAEADNSASAANPDKSGDEESTLQ